MRLHQGFSLLSIIVGIASSSLLLLTIAQLSSISRVNFSKNESTLQLYVDGRNAIQLLRQYVPMAGVGIQQPASAAAPNIRYTVLGAGAGTPPLPGGGPAVLKDWVYVGMNTIPNSPAPPSYTYAVSATPQPTFCSSQANLLKSIPSATPSVIRNNFMGLQGAKCYYDTNPSWSTVSASTYLNGLCCANLSNGTNCANPVYSCGASNGGGLFAGSVYQKLVPHLDVPTIGAAIGGDTLRVYFSNRGPQSMKSYDGTTIPAETSAGPPANAPPLTLYNYTFQIAKNGSTYTLQMTDAGSGRVYNVANNIEYMAVLVGESDRIRSKDIAGDGTQTMQLPEMNRYVRFNAPNLYAYRITALRIALVVQSNDNVLATASAPTLTLMTGSNNVPITYTPPQADRKLRKVFVTTIYLNSYALPEFRMNCVPGTAGGYQLQTSGISFTQTAASANDLCCVTGGAPAPCTGTTVFPTLNACEAKRMTGGC
jgi:Type IV Pilus-assembly protein W